MGWNRSIAVGFIVLGVVSAAAPKGHEVQWVGELHKVMLGEDSGVISLESLGGSPDLQALGPLEGLNGEITVFGGDPVIATIRDGVPHIEHTSRVRAPLLVWAHVGAWRPVPLPEEVKSLEELDRFVAASAAAVGSELTPPFPIRVTGRVAEMAMHIVNRQEREARGHEAHAKLQVQVPVQDAEVELVGFWSDRHQRIFTHQGTHLHVHGRTADGKLSGHVDEVTFSSGQLWLPSGP